MTVVHTGGASVDPYGDAVWDGFARALAPALASAEPGEALALDAPLTLDPDARRLTIRTIGGPHGQIWVTVGGTGAVAPAELRASGTQADATELAEQVRDLLRGEMGAVLPEILLASCNGPRLGAFVETAGLATETIREPTPDVEPAMLRAQVRTALREVDGVDDVREDGEFLLVGGLTPAPIAVLVDPVRRAVRVETRAVRDIYSRRATSVELALLNRDEVRHSWRLYDRSVMVETWVPLDPFVPGHLGEAVERLAQAFRYGVHDLAFRTGGTVG